MIEIDIGPYMFSAGSFFVSWHGFFSFIAILTAVFLVGRWAPMKNIDPDHIYSIAIWAVIGGILGARLVHVIDNLSYYSDNPAQIIAIWSGGIGVWGGILGGFIGGAIYALIKGHPVGIIADLTAPALLVAQTIGRIGDIINGEHCAKVTDFFLGFSWTHPLSAANDCSSGINNPVQPVIAYEMLWNIFVLAIVWKLRNRIKPDGMLFALYLALYSIGRFLITFAREDKIWAFGMQEAQYIALMVLIITVPLLLIKARLKPVELSESSEIIPDMKGTRAQRRRRGRNK